MQDRPFDIIAIGASAGGLSVISDILRRLPDDFPIPILVVQHRSVDSVNLAKLLTRGVALFVKDAEDNEKAMPGHVYVAPPDRHLVVREGGILKLSDYERVSYSRPSIDQLFFSVAQIYGKKAIGAVLSGANRDGASGAVAIKFKGGRVFVQDPEECLAGYMPRSVLDTMCFDFVLPAEEIARAIMALVMVPGASAIFPAQKVVSL